jgi:hypothetical protein
MTLNRLLDKGGSAWRWRLSMGGALRELMAHRGAVFASLSREGGGDLALIRQTRCRVPLLLSDIAALHILACVRAAARLGGAMAEAGVLMGGSARLICEAKGSAVLHLFDTFDEPPDQRPGVPAGRAGELQGHFREIRGSLGVVCDLLAPYDGVEIHSGIFPATTIGIDAEQYGFVHLDLDLVPSTEDALEFFHPRLLPGAILIGDDYQDPALKSLFRRFFAGRPDTLVELPWGQVMIVRSALPNR